jgi:hypothetical protein
MRSFAHRMNLLLTMIQGCTSQSVTWIICWASPQQYQLHSTNSLVAVCRLHPTPGPNLISQDYSTLFIVILSSCIGRTDPIITEEGQWGPLHYLYPNTRSGASCCCCWILDPPLPLCCGSFLHHSSTLAAWTLIILFCKVLKISKVLLFSNNKISWRKLKSLLEWYSGIFYFAPWNF